ncbi:MAG: transcriptional regulator [Vicinamibacteraceae bacterium]|nr:transcriptional regulator [Vicinamibacteraceae bacterium]
MMIKADRNYEAGQPPDARLGAAIGQLMQEMTEAGILLAAEGLEPSSKGALVRAVRSRISITDGPFAEAKEVVGGFAILKAASRDEALQLASRFMQLHADILGPEWEGECEVRQISEWDPPS